MHECGLGLLSPIFSTVAYHTLGVQVCRWPALSQKLDSLVSADMTHSRRCSRFDPVMIHLQVQGLSRELPVTVTGLVALLLALTGRGRGQRKQPQIRAQNVVLFYLFNMEIQRQDMAIWSTPRRPAWRCVMWDRDDSPRRAMVLAVSCHLSSAHTSRQEREVDRPYLMSRYGIINASLGGAIRLLSEGCRRHATEKRLLARREEDNAGRTAALVGGVWQSHAHSAACLPAFWRWGIRVADAQRCSKAVA